MLFDFIDHSPNIGYVITRKVNGATFARTSAGVWSPFTVEHIIPLPDPTTDILGIIRSADVPPDTRDGDTLIVFEGVGSPAPVPTAVFNLLSGVPAWGPRINQIQVR